MKNECFNVRYISVNNCFLYLSERWLEKLKDSTVVIPVLKVEYGSNKCGYFSWSPESHGVHGADEVGVSATFAQTLGIKDGETVSVSLWSSAATVGRIDVSPVTADDWEILELSSEEVQSSLLDQVRVVWRGQVLVVWVSKSLHLSLRVDNLDSSCEVGILEPLSDVVVAPPGTQVAAPEGNPVPEQADESITAALWRTFRSVVPVRQEKTPEKKTNLHSLESWRRKPPTLVCRVHPVPGAAAPFLQPYSALISKCFLSENSGGDLICKASRVPFPTDSKAASIHVRLLVIENLPDSAKELLDKVTTRHATVLMSDTARGVLGVRTGARVSLEILSSSRGHVVSGIQIAPLLSWDKDLRQLELLCRTYIAEQVELSPLVVNSGAPLPLSSTVSVHVTLSPPEATFTVLNSDDVRKCKFTVQEKAEKILDYTFLEEESPADNSHFYLWSGLKKLISEALIGLEMSLNLLPLTTPLLPSRTNVSLNNILILGTAGSGKTTLANVICQELKQAPHFVHCVRVQCKQLKGKRIENLQKLATQWLSECVYYQPAVLILDDLDAIAGVGSSTPGDEETNYFMRVGDMLRNTLAEYQSTNYISVIAIAQSVLKLNSTLAAPRGVHIFHTVLEIPELNKTDRLEMLKEITTHRSDVKSQGLDKLDWDRFAGRAEGYVVQDLVDVLDKIVFASMKRKGGNCLCDEDFEDGLNNTVPLLQRGVELYEGEGPSWEDVGGLSEVKQILIEVLQWPSQYPELFENAPLRHQSGLLLYGAPGTGKTLLAGAVARECGLRFISIKGPELLSKYIGASEEAVRNIFQKAQSAKPCILFFDEFDSLAPRRGHDSTGVTDRVVNQLLTQLDGVEALHGVWVMAATSRPDLIDPALLRPGRLDRTIHCPLPDKDDRFSILHALSRKLNLSDEVDLEELSSRMEGFTGADLQAVLYTAQLRALEEDIHLKESCAADSNGPELSAGSGPVPVVRQEDLEAALRDTRPSLSGSEKLKYKLIYDKFQGRPGVPSAPVMPQRVTLA